MSDLEIKQTRFGAPAAKALVAAAQAELAARYGSGDENPVEAVEFDPPEGCFLVAYQGGEPVACGGWRTLAHFSAAHFSARPDGSVVGASADTDDAITGDAITDDASAGGAFGEDVAEIKRMYAVPAVRGSGVAAALLKALEESARDRGMRRLVLETGDQQPEAIRFYERHSYRRIPNYGYYKDSDGCLSFALDL